MFYSYKNTKLTINNFDFLISEASISLESNSEPRYLAGNRHAFDYSAENGIGGVLNLTYYLTGQDYLKNYLTEEQTVLSGNFGGLFFKSGYLSNYNLRGAPNRPVFVSAEIVFFDELLGNFAPTYESQNQEILPLNFSDCLFVVSNDNQEGNNILNVNTLNYQFSSEIIPVYTVGNQVPDRIAFGRKTINLNLETNSLSGDLPITGKNAGLTINLYDNSKSILKETYAVNGNLFQRNFNVSVGQILNSAISIKQNYVDIEPTILGFNPLSGYQGQGILISGDNFSNTISLKINDLESNFTIIDDNTITGNIPYGAATGPIKISTFGGTQSTTGNFIVLQSGIVVNGFFPTTGSIFETVTISGDNFYKINKVLFNTGESTFNTINNNIIIAEVPQTASWGLITIFSDERGITGVSSNKFTPIPIIDGFSPVSGISGDSIIITGKAFSGVNYLSFNNLSGQFTVNNNYQITAIVPSGNTNGLIRISGENQVKTSSPYNFNPLVKITGLTPASGLTGSAINIFGLNFYDNLMYPTNSKFLVSFTNATGLFDRISDTQLSGFVPEDAISGPVYIHAPDNSKYPDTGNFTLIYSAPIINNLQPSSGKNNDFILANGRNLININEVIISGSTGASIISNYSVSNFNNFISFQLPNVTGGKYDLIIRTNYGAVTGDDLLTVLDRPIISGFNPISGFAGSRVTLTGKNIYPISKIYIGNTGIPAGTDTGSFNQYDNTVDFFIPTNAPSSGNIILFNSVEYITGSYFTKFNNQIISGFTPLTGEINSEVVISGSDFNIVNEVFIGTKQVNTFTYESSTGIRFTIPNDTLSDFIILNSQGGADSSNEKLIVLAPLIEISGFSPTGAFINENVIISGKNFNTILEIAISGENNQELLIFQNDFVYQSNTGVEFTVPPLSINGLIKLTNSRNSVYTNSQLNILQLPIIQTITPNSGYYNQTIQISGSGLAGKEFYFSSPTGRQLIKSLNTIIVDDTGASIVIPKDIISTNITISGNDRLLNNSNDIFIPLPTISGVNITGFTTGNVIVITGINSYEASTLFLGITGADNISAIVCDNLSGNYINLTGDGFIDNTTGYATFSGIINNNFAGTGKLFLIHQNSNEAYYNYDINNLLSNQIISISPGAPVIYGFNPMSGGSGTTVTLSGAALNTVTGLYFTSGSNIESGFILSKSYTELIFNPPTGLVFYPRTSGQIQLVSFYGDSTSTDYFSILNIPIISGFTPTQGITGANVRITGFGLENITQLYFGNTIANFTTHFVNDSWELTGIVPNPEIIPQSVYITALNPAGSGISSNRFTISDGSSSNFETFTSSDVDITGSFPNNQLFEFSHGLSQTPKFLEWNLVNYSGELGYSIGDEVNINSLIEITNLRYHYGFTYKNSTVVGWMYAPGSLGANGAIPNKNTFVPQTFNTGAWKVRVVART